MSKAKRTARKQGRLAKTQAAAQQRVKRKQLRQEEKTQRVANRQGRKTDRQDLRQQGREDNLKVRISNRAKEIKRIKKQVQNDLNEQANKQSTTPDIIARQRIESAPETINKMRRYVAEQKQVPVEDVTEDTDQLLDEAVLMRAEELEDLREPIAEEIEAEGDEVYEEFENFEFFEAAAFVNELEFPENFENAAGIIDPSTWATIQGAAKGGLEVIAQKRFAQGKKFLGKTEKEWKAPTDPNAPTEVVYKNIEEQYKSNFVKDNLVAIILTAIVLSLLIYFAFKSDNK